MNTIIADKLAILAEDEIAIKAIKFVFANEIEKEKPVVGGEDNELLGQQYRAYEKAKAIIDEAIKSIENYKKRSENNNNYDKSK